MLISSPNVSKKPLLVLANWFFQSDIANSSNYQISLDAKPDISPFTPSLRTSQAVFGPSRIRVSLFPPPKSYRGAVAFLSCYKNKISETAEITCASGNGNEILRHRLNPIRLYIWKISWDRSAFANVKNSSRLISIRRNPLQQHFPRSHCSLQSTNFIRVSRSPSNLPMKENWGARSDNLYSEVSHFLHG